MLRPFAFSAMIVLAASATVSVLAACNGAVSLDGTSGDGLTADSGPSQGPLDGGPGGNPEGGPDSDGEMMVDDVVCTGVSAVVTAQTAPDGRTWTLSLDGTCGAFGVVHAFAASKDDVPYPQACGDATRVQLSVGAEGDAGFLAYSTDGGSCTVASGPSVGAQGTAVSLDADVVASGGRGHRLRYNGKAPAARTPLMRVDTQLCTGVTAKVTPQTAPDGRTWTFDLAGACGSLGRVDAFVVSKDDIPYPQTCSAQTHARVSIGAEGDAGMLAYDSSPGSGVITSGPSTAAQGTPVRFDVTVSNAAGVSHTITYDP